MHKNCVIISSELIDRSHYFMPGNHREVKGTDIKEILLKVTHCHASETALILYTLVFIDNKSCHSLFA